MEAVRRQARCLAGALLLLACPAQAHHKPIDDYFKETWTTRDGLPHNLVHNIAQTPDGYLWFATWEGVARYNGREFHVFDRGNVPELRDNGVRAMQLGRDGTLWLGTSRGGVTRLRDGHWKTYTQADGLAQDEIMDLLEDSRGRLWIATESAGVDMLYEERFTHFTRAGGLPSDVLYGFVEDSEGTVWAATAEGLARFDGDRFASYGGDRGLPRGQVFSVAAGPAGELYVGTEAGLYHRIGTRFEILDPALPRDNVTRVLRDHEGALWLGTVNGGLYRYSEHGVEQLSSQRGLPNDRVSALFEDREHSLWIGTNAGLMRLRDAPFTTFTTEHGLPDAYVRSVVQTADARLWIGTSRGLGRFEQGRFMPLTRADGLPGDSILSLAPARDGSLWIGTYSNGVVRWRDGVAETLSVAGGLPGNQVRAVLEARDGTLWIGTTRGLARRRGGELRVFTAADGLPRDFVIALHEDGKGQVWAGTANGLARVDGERVIAHSLEAMDDAQDVFGFHETDDGTLWLATDRGLVRLRGGEMRLVGRRQGLPLDTVFQVVDDGLDNFWLTSNRGVLRAARAELDAVADGRRASAGFETFGEADGMASAQCNGGSGPVAWRSGDGRLWFGTSRGLAMTDPHKLAEAVREPPPVVLEELRVDDRSVPLQPHVELPSGTRRVELHFAGLSYLMPQKMRYRYRLEGFDREWVERGTLRFAQFTNLAPGDYIFRVAAANPDGAWSRDEARLSFRVAPTLVQRGEFWLVLALVALVLLYALYAWRVHALQQAQLRLRSLVDQRTADLREQTERLTQADTEKTALLGKLREQSEAFERQAREDSLTGLANRRNFDELLAQEFARAQRSGHSLSVALADLDHFKRINDGYSHAAGDAALRATAMLMRATCRGVDVLARWGGEEFALLFPDTALEEAWRVCERLRQAVESYDCAAFAPGFRLTVSIGVSDMTGLNHHEKLISRADASLYEAKRRGRNQVVGATPP
jgi:diguanylate cyclase (GGDEF)-like protein